MINLLTIFNEFIDSVTNILLLLVAIFLTAFTFISFKAVQAGTKPEMVIIDVILIVIWLSLLHLRLKIPIRIY